MIILEIPKRSEEDQKKSAVGSVVEDRGGKKNLALAETGDLQIPFWAKKSCIFFKKMLF